MNTFRYLSSVDNTNPSQNEISGTDWQVMGKLELPIGSGADDAIESWLVETLSLLNLRTDFLNKVLKSAQEVAARAMQAEALMQFKHVHLLVFAPPDHASNRHNWGFFRIEKVENASVQDYPSHEIEFYLYQEGKC
jgi:hypothetical protein